MTAGRLVPHKNFDIIIKAFYLLTQKQRATSKKLKLTIVGEGPEKQALIQIIDRLDLANDINLTGILSQKKFHSLLKTADIFALSSNYEGLPHVIIEAMLLEVPVVASDIAGNREVIKHKQSGLLVSINEGEFLKAFLQLINNKKLSNSLSKNAKIRAKKNFNWEIHTQRLISFFRKELAKTERRQCA